MSATDRLFWMRVAVQVATTALALREVVALVDEVRALRVEATP